MASKTGTYTVSSLLAASAAASAIPFGIDTIAEVLEKDNAAYDQAMTDALADIAETTTDRQRFAGTSIGGDMMELDETGTGYTQNDIPGYPMGFPLRRTGFPVGWTVQWEKNASPADYAIKNSAAQGADYRRTLYELQKAIFTPTNYSFTDKLVDNGVLAVKALVNADSQGIANGPNGLTFDGSTHTHYDGSATLTATAINAQIADIAEHRDGARIRININQADAAAFAALTGFVALVVPYVGINTAANQPVDPRLDISRIDNRMIGYFGAAEVWTKPWVPANYSVAVDVGAPRKPLVRRVEINDRGLHIAAQVDVHPLRATHIEHFYGFGAWNRVAMHCLKFNNATYSAPTLTY